MLDLLLLIAFIALPIGAWLASASLTWVTTRLIFAFGVAGAAVQTSISFGGAWNLLGLVAIISWTGLTCFVIFYSLARVKLLRVDTEKEFRGKIIFLYPQFH